MNGIFPSVVFIHGISQLSWLVIMQRMNTSIYSSHLPNWSPRKETLIPKPFYKSYDILPFSNQLPRGLILTNEGRKYVVLHHNDDCDVICGHLVKGSNYFSRSLSLSWYKQNCYLRTDIKPARWKQRASAQLDLIASDAGKITRTLARVYRDGERVREREREERKSSQKDNHGSIEMIHNGSMQGRPKLTVLKYVYIAQFC